jgi:hypothetical protein
MSETILYKDELIIISTKGILVDTSGSRVGAPWIPIAKEKIISYKCEDRTPDPKREPSYRTMHLIIKYSPDGLFSFVPKEIEHFIGRNYTCPMDHLSDNERKLVKEFLESREQIMEAIHKMMAG